MSVTLFHFSILLFCNGCPVLSTVLAETKGNHRDISDSKQKIELGNAWANAAGRNYQYYMVFDNAEAPLDGAVALSQFVETLYLLRFLWLALMNRQAAIIYASL